MIPKIFPEWDASAAADNQSQVPAVNFLTPNGPNLLHSSKLRDCARKRLCYTSKKDNEPYGTRYPN